jgi:phosphate-selective porin OprO and OprP
VARLAIRWTGTALITGAAALTAVAPAFASPEFKLRGRIHMDYAVYDEDEIELDDGFFNRRARIGVQGTIDEDWSGIIEYDFAENGTSAADVFISRKLGGGALKIGHFKVPMGFDELSSTNTIPFIERASSDTAFVDARRLGIGYERFAGELGFQGMLYGRGMGSGNNPDGDDPIGAGARVVYAPTLGDGQLHLAASLAYEDRKDLATARYGDRPEARVDGKRLVDTGTIADVSSTLKYGLETYWQGGPYSVLAEYFGVSVDRDAGPEPDFSGWYVQGTWFLTGENRSYRAGTYRGVKPGSPRGAWELAARYSSVDLNDSSFQGGKQDNVTLGVNYYAGPNVRFMLNLVLVDVSDSGVVLDGVTVGDESPNILIARGQFHF